MQGKGSPSATGGCCEAGARHSVSCRRLLKTRGGLTCHDPCHGCGRGPCTRHLACHRDHACTALWQPSGTVDCSGGLDWDSIGLWPLHSFLAALPTRLLWCLRGWLERAWRQHAGHAGSLRSGSGLTHRVRQPYTLRTASVPCCDLNKAVAGTRTCRHHHHHRHGPPSSCSAQTAACADPCRVHNLTRLRAPAQRIIVGVLLPLQEALQLSFH